MSWQDVIFTLGSIGFSVALLPSVLGAEKPDVRTSAMTGSILAAFVVPYVSLSLWFSAASTAVLASLWMLLVAQRIKQDASTT